MQKMNVLSLLAISMAMVLAFSSSSNVLVSAQSNPLCHICEFGARLVHTFLKQNATAVEIELGLSILCALAPTSVQPRCNDFVLHVLPVMLKDLAAGKTAEQACVDLGDCTSTAPAVVDHLTSQHDGSINPKNFFFFFFFTADVSTNNILKLGRIFVDILLT
jgi:hypothetical protein